MHKYHIPSLSSRDFPTKYTGATSHHSSCLLDCFPDDVHRYHLPSLSSKASPLKYTNFTSHHFPLGIPWQSTHVTFHHFPWKFFRQSIYMMTLLITILKSFQTTSHCSPRESLLILNKHIFTCHYNYTKYHQSRSKFSFTKITLKISFHRSKTQLLILQTPTG